MPISELQVALLGAGVAAVAAVWGYNVWQERAHKKLAEKIFQGGQPDVLLKGQRDPDSDVRVEPSASAGQRIEPVAAAVVDDAVAGPPAAWADDIADCLLHIEFAAAVAAPALWEQQAVWATQLTKRLAWMGYDGEQWRRLTPHDAGSYARVAVALQLADRQGAVSAAEIEIFRAGAQGLAQQFSGLVELPAPQDVLVHAQALDDFCAGVDVQLGVNIVETAGGSFAGTKLRGLAEAAGLSLREDGLFHASDDNGMTWFTLGNMGAELFAAESLKTLATYGVTFVLDVPRVIDGPAVFDRMLAAARQMAQGLGGTLVDGQRHVLSDAMIAGIRAKIAEVQQQMTANQIPPGSPRALRLFS